MAFEKAITQSHQMGITTCFYYKSEPNIVHISAMNIMTAMSAAEKTDYFKRIDISEDSRTIDVYDKK